MDNPKEYVMKIKLVSSLAVVALVICHLAFASAAEWGLQKGAPELKSAGPLALSASISAVSRFSCASLKLKARAIFRAASC